MWTKGVQKSVPLGPGRNNKGRGFSLFEIQDPQNRPPPNCYCVGTQRVITSILSFSEHSKTWRFEKNPKSERFPLVFDRYTTRRNFSKGRFFTELSWCSLETYHGHREFTPCYERSNVWAARCGTRGAQWRYGKLRVDCNVIQRHVLNISLCTSCYRIDYA